MRYITTEQVSKYHPDKYADQISDKIATYLLRKNPQAKTAIETMVKDNTVIVAGEISGVKLSDKEIKQLVYEVADDLGYEVFTILNLIGEQSVEIKSAVEKRDMGAGDQGLMFGYAIRETDSYLPLGLEVANKVIEGLEKRTHIIKRADGTFTYGTLLKGDAKTQVTIDTMDNSIKTIVVSVCHIEDIHLQTVRDTVLKYLYEDLADFDLTDTEFIINPSGLWAVGGPTSDCGLTGRKIVADQYGAYMPVGGGAFSGKDLTKVDRSAAYQARLTAVDILRHRPEIEWVKVHVGYAIGRAYPVSLSITSDKGDIEVDEAVIESFKVGKLVKRFYKLNLYELSKGCHFREMELLL